MAAMRNDEILNTNDIEVKVQKDKKKGHKKDNHDDSNGHEADGYFTWPMRRETEQTVFHDVYGEPKFNAKKVLAEVSKGMKEIKNAKWRIIIPFVILTIAVSVSILISLYSAIGGTPVARITKLENEVLEDMSQLQQLHQNFTALMSIGLHPSNPIRSCGQLPSYYPPGNYYLIGNGGSSTLQYCTTPPSCYGGSGAWAKVAKWNMNDSSHLCPAGLLERIDSGIRTCVRANINEPTCSMGIQYNLAGIEFSRVCGKIIGYQIGNTNAFKSNPSQFTDPSSLYVDGVILTHGRPSTHIWTFAVGLNDSPDPSELVSKCDCSVGNSSNPASRTPRFVGEDYFCDSGYRSGSPPGRMLLKDDPLWDGAGCGSSSTCCTFNKPPWFFRQLRRPTSEYIEMRLCSDELARYEDIAVESVEIYVQ